MMQIEYVHASKYGNGSKVAAEFARQMAARGDVVEVHHIRELRPANLAPADLYVFSSPGRFGRPLRRMRRFLERLSLPAGTRFAILTTEAALKPSSPAEGQRVRPIMTEILERKGFVAVAEDAVFVTGIKGPLEPGWQQKVEAFAEAVAASLAGQRSVTASTEESVRATINLRG